MGGGGGGVKKGLFTRLPVTLELRFYKSIVINIRQSVPIDNGLKSAMVQPNGR